jgi:hypothetical protein
MPAPGPGCKKNFSKKSFSKIPVDSRPARSYAMGMKHWSKPFVAAMNERALQDALQAVPEAERAGLKIVENAVRWAASK